MLIIMSSGPVAVRGRGGPGGEGFVFGCSDVDGGGPVQVEVFNCFPDPATLTDVRVQEKKRKEKIQMGISDPQASTKKFLNKKGFKLKKVTNLTGLLVCRNPKHILNRLYKSTILLLEKMPPQAAYRKYTQDIINQRASIINSTEDVRAMEEKIGCGQIEEVIVQARNELELARQMLLVRPWESLSAPVPENQWKWPVK